VGRIACASKHRSTGMYASPRSCTTLMPIACGRPAIQKWLKAGVIQGGVWSKTEQGTPQDASVSTLLNVYLHEVFDRWVCQWRCRYTRGDVIVVRYPDDTVAVSSIVVTQSGSGVDLRGRFQRLDPELQEGKTRLIECRRHAARDGTARALPKPETFEYRATAQHSRRPAPGLPRARLA
jgi:hypothetical protein